MKEIVTRSRVWGKPIDQMDVWLDTQGFYRKHTARDGTCLFRAVSEQLFLTQAFHLEVRRQTVEYELRHIDYFQKMVTCPFEDYADKMRNPREWGGKVEIEAMARLYKHDFEMFQDIGKPAEAVTNNGYKKKITLCYSQDRHYDSVYTKDYIATAAYCQSTVYEVLYKNVFDLKEVDYAVKKMLHDKTSRYQRDHIPFLSSGFVLRLEMRDNYLNVKDLLDFGITPFPYKVAKSLDCEVYRNVEYDTWNEYRKGLRYGFCAWSCRELQVGVKCLVKLEDDSTHHGHIQEMQANKGPVLVFIEQLGEMMTVPYDSLELLPPSSPTSTTPTRPFFPFKLPTLSLSDDDGNKNKRVPKNLPLRPKLKESNSFPGKQELQNKESSKENETQNPAISTTEYYEQELDYQQQNDENNYHTQSYSSQGSHNNEEHAAQGATKLDNAIPVMMPMDSYRYPTYTVNPPLALPLPETTQTTFQTTSVPVNLMAPKSLNIDGSDLPHSDVATLRFFYNLGLDHLRMNCVQWNVRPGNTYYLNGVLPSPTSYVSIDSPTAPQYEQNFVQPTPDGRRRDIISSPVAASLTSESEGSQTTVPPRFKNKSKPIPNTVKRNGAVYEQVPVIQQCEVSSTTNVGVPLSPVYYPQVDCEPAYCMAVPYVDYNVYEYPSHTYTPTSYIGPDGMVYQTILPPGVVPTTPTM